MRSFTGRYGTTHPVDSSTGFAILARVVSGRCRDSGRLRDSSGTITDRDMMLCRSSSSTVTSCTRFMPEGLQPCRAPPSSHGAQAPQRREREGPRSGRSFCAGGTGACRPLLTSTFSQAQSIHCVSQAVLHGQPAGLTIWWCHAVICNLRRSHLSMLSLACTAVSLQECMPESSYLQNAASQGSLHIRG